MWKGVQSSQPRCTSLQCTAFVLPVNYPVRSPVTYASTWRINKCISRIFLKIDERDNFSKTTRGKKTIRTDSAAPKSSSPYPWVKVTPVQEVLIHSETKANKIPADMWESSERQTHTHICLRRCWLIFCNIRHSTKYKIN